MTIGGLLRYAKHVITTASMIFGVFPQALGKAAALLVRLLVRGRKALGPWHIGRACAVSAAPLSHHTLDDESSRAAGHRAADVDRPCFFLKKDPNTNGLEFVPTQGKSPYYVK